MALRLQPGSPDLELMSMWVAPEARRQGGAEALVGAVADWASTTPATAVHLWVRRNNHHAQRLYRRLGFTETGELQPMPSHPCADELRMVRRLRWVDRAP